MNPYKSYINFPASGVSILFWIQRSFLTISFWRDSGTDWCLKALIVFDSNHSTNIKHVYAHFRDAFVFGDAVKTPTHIHIQKSENVHIEPFALPEKNETTFDTNPWSHRGIGSVEWRWATLEESLDPESNRISEWKEEREYLGASKLLAQVWLHKQICEMFQAMERRVSSMPFRTFCLIDKFWQNKCTCILKGLIIYLQHNILSYQYIFF